ncbi:hypothetical protein C8R46DRAFT_1343847 [Mycena filopes]|nr:hypothetical protein C8R46DRAFT_1343847 [Mycena filopes]
MLRLPVELLELIFSSVDKEGLRSLFHTSRVCRTVAPPHLLSRYHLSMDTVHSGVISILPGQFFLIPIIYHIHPIQELIIATEKPPLDQLVSILRELPPIPNVVLSGQTLCPNIIAVAALIATLSRDSRDPVVGVGWTTVILSLPRHSAPLKKALWPTPLPRLRISSPADTARDIIWGILLALPLLLILLTSSIYNIYVLIDWICRRVFKFGPPMDQVQRIVQDLEIMAGNPMRLQTLSASDTQFTLVTFTGDSSLTIPRIPGLTRAMSSAVLAALDLGTGTLRLLKIERNAALDLSALLSFLHRHGALTDVTLRPDALHHASLSDVVIPSAYDGHLTLLTAPAAYIPPLLRFERRITHLTITDANARPHHLPTVLAALAANPTPPPISLQLDLSPPAHTLPWRVAGAHDIEVATALPSVRRLVVSLAYKMQFVARDVEAFPRWLERCFPALVYLQLPRQAVSARQQVALRAALAAQYTAFAALSEGLFFV